MSEQFDVVIVGAGLSGAALALGLSDLPLRIAMLEAAPESAMLRDGLPFERLDAIDCFDLRVSALAESSRDFLQAIGAWSELDERCCLPYQHMHVWDGPGTASIDFDAREVHSPSLGTIVENGRLLSAMHRALKSKVNLNIFWQQEALEFTRHEDEQGNEFCRLRLKNEGEIEARLLVGADGANSRIRSAFKFETREWDYGHHAIVATVKTANSHQNTAWQRFDEEGPLAFLPLPDGSHNGSYCSIVWSVQADRAQQLMALTEQEFTETLQSTLEEQLGPILAVSDRQSFPLRQRHAKDYIKHNVVLVADAAHTIHPLAGQGLNLGLQDVEALVDVLREAVGLGLPCNQPLLLKRYQRQRQTDNLAMMAIMEGFKRLFGSSDPLLRLLRNTGMDWVDQQQLLKKQVIRRAMGIS